ncbi:MAG: sulfotransferase [Thiohalocapsa sp.]|jgi:hypothetical protein|uniref:sulfotransferase n=1 Tax=Thiohalocapsa sp. TaxID=2497641 RepID=UPI0025EC4E54|nr:sulfotransferase [Thiohalocapsa sp.]MCG6941970.1 sulfotransferase [Thiohalocapsa sp.]
MNSSKITTVARAQQLVDQLSRTRIGWGSDSAGRRLSAEIQTLRGRLASLRDKAEPGHATVRLIHHFACTGGTLISKCIAALPNVRLLSEADPLSPFPQGPFAPTDLIALSRFGVRGGDRNCDLDVFRRGMAAMYADSLRNGLRLVLRDHAHGHFCHGASVAERPSLREIVASDYDTRCVLTVRHPMDSYLSLRKNAWLHFQPDGLDEYARRYHAFLDRYATVPIFRYEEFVSYPQATVARMCSQLLLEYSPNFLNIFQCISLSGDSGRGGNTIEPRPRRNCPDDVREQAQHSAHYAALLTRLGYRA